MNKIIKKKKKKKKTEKNKLLNCEPWRFPQEYKTID